MIDTSAVLLVAAMLCITALAIAAMFHEGAREAMGEASSAALALVVSAALGIGVATAAVWVGASVLMRFGWMP